MLTKYPYSHRKLHRLILLVLFILSGVAASYFSNELKIQDDILYLASIGLIPAFIFLLTSLSLYRYFRVRKIGRIPWEQTVLGYAIEMLVSISLIWLLRNLIWSDQKGLVDWTEIFKYFTLFIYLPIFPIHIALLYDERKKARLFCEQLLLPNKEEEIPQIRLTAKNGNRSFLLQLHDFVGAKFHKRCVEIITYQENMIRRLLFTIKRKEWLNAFNEHPYIVFTHKRFLVDVRHIQKVNRSPKGAFFFETQGPFYVRISSEFPPEIVEAIAKRKDLSPPPEEEFSSPDEDGIIPMEQTQKTKTSTEQEHERGDNTKEPQ